MVLNPNTPLNANQLQNPPKFITVHGRWAVMIGDITNKWSVSLYE